jgi:hypothetical protein
MSSQVKNPVSPNYETKNTSTFQLFHCQQTQSLLITPYYLHEMAEQEEDMKRKRILLTAREKQGIVNYYLERRELTPLT